MNTKLLRQKILDLAIRGKLTDQRKSDGTAADLLKDIVEAKSKKNGVILSGARSAKSKDPEQIIPLDKGEAPFEIPENWEWVRLGDVASLCLGKMLDKSKNKGTYCRYLRNVNIRWGEFDFSDIAEMKFEDVADNRFLIKYGDLVMCEGGEPGRCAVWTDSDTIHFQKALHRIRFFNGFIPKFYQYLFFFYANKKILDNYFTGSTIKHLTGESLREIPIPLPPLAEQQRIVAKIEEAFAEIDAIEKNKELLKTHIKQTRQKILDLAIHGKLVPQNKSDEPASVLLERITRDNPHYEKLADVPFEIPDSWEWVKLGEVAYIASGSTPSKDCFVENGVPYLKMYNLRNQQIDFEYKPQYIKREIHEGKLARSKAKPGDVIMNIVGPPLGKVALVPETLPECNFNQAAVLIRAYFDTNLMNQYIRYFLLQMDEINAINTKGTAGQENISLTQTQNMRFPLPPLAEQKRIVDKIEEVFASLDEISLHLV